MQEQLWSLPTKPGTVISIGAWWFIRLESYEGKTDTCWELLPPRSPEASHSMYDNGFDAQHAYTDATVLAEAEQEGGYFVISEPVDRPYGPTIRRQEIGPIAA